MARRINVITTHAHQMFVEMALACRDTLVELDFDARYINTASWHYDDGDFNIFICTRPRRIPRSVCNINVLFETDHIMTDFRQRRPVNYMRYTRSLHWFDYKEDLRHRNIYFCPLGYSKHFDSDLPRKSLWPYFHMGLTLRNGPRDRLRRRFNIDSPYVPGGRNFIFGRARDQLICRSKVNINSRAFDDYWFTPLHAALVLFKGKMLLQDDCGKDDYYFFKPYLNLFTEEDFLDKLNYWIDHDRKRREWEHFIHEDIKARHPFQRYFYEALGDLLEDYR